MEKGIEVYFKEQLNIPKVDIKTYSPLALAYIGDAVYDLIVRTMIVSAGNMQVKKYHRTVSEIVKAKAQAGMIEVLEPHLTKEEESVYKRGRNATSYTKAKNASMIEYRRATGFEALLGYLYLQEEYTRVIDLVQLGNQLLEAAGKTGE